MPGKPTNIDFGKGVEVVVRSAGIHHGVPSIEIELNSPGGKTILRFLRVSDRIPLVPFGIVCVGAEPEGGGRKHKEE